MMHVRGKPLWHVVNVPRLHCARAAHGTNMGMACVRCNARATEPSSLVVCQSQVRSGGEQSACGLDPCSPLRAPLLGTWMAIQYWL